MESLGLDFISLSSILERGAKEGKLLYFPLDPHWNSEGTELVATYVAEYFKTKYFSLQISSTESRSNFIIGVVSENKSGFHRRERRLSIAGASLYVPFHKLFVVGSSTSYNKKDFV